MARESITGKRIYSARCPARCACSRPIGIAPICPRGSRDWLPPSKRGRQGFLSPTASVVLLVAHLALMRPDLPIAAALLVAPADVESARHTPDHIRGFAPIPRLRLPFRSIVVASTDDPFMAFARARDLSEDWGAGFVDAGASGHINVEAGFGPWPAGERIVNSLISEQRPSRKIARPSLDVMHERDVVVAP